MLSELVTNKLKKILNPDKSRFDIILYNSTQDIPTIKEFIKKSYPKSKDKTLKLQDRSYSELTDDLYTDNSFIYIDDFEEIFSEDELYLAFNQRRDKLASFSINLIVFYPKRLQTKLYQDALKFIPDLWEFRTAVIELEGSDKKIEKLDIKEDRSFIEYSGLSYNERLKEIKRLEEKLKTTTLEELKGAIYNDLAFLYQELGEYEKALPLYEKSLKISEEVLGENHPSTATI